MSRYTGPRLRILRRLQVDTLPGLVVAQELKRKYPPGQHGPTQRVKLSDFAIRLREKQKLRFHYGVGEKQFRRYMLAAKHGKGNTGENLLILLESRLDNVIYRLGFARTIRGARQIVNHGHVDVNGKRVTVPSYDVRPSQIVSIRVNSGLRERIATDLQGPGQNAVPEFLERTDNELKGRMKTRPTGQDCPLDKINESLVVELYAISM